MKKTLTMILVLAMVFVLCGVPTTAMADSTHYTLSYDLNGGTGSPSSNGTEAGTYDYNTWIHVPSQGSVAKPHNTFLGWKINGTGEIVTHSNNQWFQITGNTTLVAQWNPEWNYTVTFKDGTTTVDTRSVTAPATTVSSLPSIPTVSGYINDGWKYSGSDFTTSTSVSGNITVTAQRHAAYVYTVTFMDGTTTVGTRTVTEPATTVSDLPAIPTVAGQTNDGWKANGASGYFTTSTSVTGNITVYAQRHANYVYTVTFKDGTTTVDTRTVTAPATTVASLPTIPTVSGYINDGWSYNGSAFTTSTTVSGNITVTAQRHAAYVYTVTFMDGTTTVGTRTVTEPATTVSSLPAIPTVAGQTNDGWKANGASGYFTTSTSVTGNVTVYAQRHPNYVYTVTFKDGTTTVDTRTVTAPATTVASLPTIPTVSGYINDGWRYNGSAFTTSTTVSSNITVTAQRHAAYVYTVTFMDGTTTVGTRTVTEPATTVSDLPAIPTVAGQTNDGWKANGASGYFTTSTSVTGNVTVYAQRHVNYEYTVTFWDGLSIIDTRTVTAPATTVSSLPAMPTYSGWINDGWRIWLSGSAFTTSTTVSSDLWVYADRHQAYSYTVTFKDGSTTVGTRTVTEPATTVSSLPAIPTVIGYTNDGWKANGASNYFTTATTVSDDITVYAQRHVNSYTITFNSNGGTPVGSITQAYGTAISAPANPTKAGYTFTGWNPAVPATMPVGGASLTAQWNANSYTITFDSDGGSTVPSITQAYGSAITAPADPTKTGYTFAGWTPSVPATMPLNGASLKAKWNINSYTITFNSAGGSIVPDITQNYGTAITAPADPTKTGYTFAGWSPAVPATMPAGGAALTAQWNINSYTITFDSDGGSLVPSITQDYNTAITAPADPTKTGYTFAGWSPSVPATMPAGGASLKAQWNVNSYTITFNSDGGSYVPDITQDYNTAVSAPADPTKAGYTFAGWSPAVPSTMPAGGAALTAQWNINSYTITFNSDGGSAVSDITQDYGTAVSAPADPTKDGYTFAGWDPSVPATMPAGGAALTAQWNINSYTITFDSDGGSYVPDITQDYGTAVSAPADPTKDGYTFAGWSPAVPSTMPAGGASLTAKWNVNSYTITFNSAGGSTVSDITQDYGTAVSAPADPTKDGYTFAGWDPSVPATMPVGGASLTAKWNVNSYTITFNSAGGSTVSDITQDYGTAVSAPADPTREGYTFEGWSPAVPATMPLNGASLTAQWTAKDYIITFDSDGGTPVGSITQAFGSAITAPADPTKDGYTFAGWNPTVPSIMPLYGLNLVAQWTANDYTLTFDSDGGTPVGSITQAFGSVVTAPAAPTKDGYTFAGWDKPVPATMPLNGASLKAQWTINTFTVTYKDYDGTTVLKTQTVDWNTNATPPADPTRTGYNFTGWDKASTGIKADTTITATYTIKTFTVTFNLDPHGNVATGSTGGLVQTVEYNGDAVPPTVDTDPGYTFLGWDVSTDNVTGNITVTARYAIKRFTLSVNVQGNGTVAGIAGTYNYGTLINLDNATTTPADGYQFIGFQDANGNPVATVTMYGTRTVTAVFTAVPASSPAASPAVSPAASVQPTQNIPENQVPQAGPGQNQGQAGGFSGYWLFLIIGLPLIVLAIILFIILGKKRRKKDEEQA